MAKPKKKKTLSAKQKAALKKARAANGKKHSAAKKRKKPAARKKAPVKKRSTAKSRSKSTVKRTTQKRSTTMPRKKKRSTVKKGRRKGSGKLSQKKAIVTTVKDAMGAVAGGVAAGFLANKLPIPNAKLKAASPIIAGVALAAVGAKKRNSMLQSVATGMVVLGAVAVIKQQFPQVPMLAGEDDDFILLPNNYEQALPYYGEPVDFDGEDDIYDEFDDELSGVVEFDGDDDLDYEMLGEFDEDEMLSPASI